MRPDADIVIVGGGPAGLATALHLAHREPRLRSRLVVLERETYPREKLCAGAIGGRGERSLGRIGVTVDAPAVPVRAIVADLPLGRVEGRSDQVVGRVVRRVEYDARLAAIARERGIRLETGVKVSGLTIANGVTVETSAGELRARVAIGADGVGSVVRRSLGLGGATWRAQAIEVDTPIVAADGPRDALRFDVEDHAFDGYGWDFPTIVDGEPLVCRGMYRLAMPGEKAGEGDIEERLARHLERRGLDLARCRKKRFAERGFAPHEAIARPHALLAGEAAGIDPITGEGIAQALLYGEFLAGYLAPRLERGDLSFGDFGAKLGRTRLGQDLRVRDFLARRFFAKGRAFYEGSLTDLPEFMHLGVRYFGGLPVSRLAAARFLVRAFARSMRKGTRDAFATVASG